MEILALKIFSQMKGLKSLWKISCQILSKNYCPIKLKWPPIYRGWETGQKGWRDSLGWDPNKICQKIELLESVRISDSFRSTGPVDRQRSYFWPLGDYGRPPRSTRTNKEHCKCPGRPERSADVHTCTACTSVDRLLSVLKNQNCRKPELGTFG